MKKHTLQAIVVLALCAVTTAVMAARVPASQHKLIHFGWWAPSTPAEILNVPLEHLDNHCPFDGIGLYPSLKLKRGDKTISYYLPRQVGAPQMLTKEDFMEFVPAFLRLHNETRLKHNFMRANSALFNADWFDDAGWKRTLNNFSMLAWFAKETKCDGLCLDIEAYEYTNQPFRYRPESGHTFEETAAQVRKRAKEWVEELNRQFPNLTLFTFFWTSQCDSVAKADHPESDYATSTGLQIAFFNGVYDGAPDTMKIVDGNEGAGYMASCDNDYTRIAANFYRFGKAWIDPKNHSKFDKITSLGISLYLDSYVPREKPGAYTLFAKTDNPVAFLHTNLRKSLEYSDEYVWVWCERGNFWPDICKNNPQLPFWDTRLPNCVAAIRAAKDPETTYMQYVQGENLLKNGSLKSGESGPHNGPDQSKVGVASWSGWQSPSFQTGVIQPEAGGVRMRGVGYGNLSQGFKDIKPGANYLLTVRCKVDSVQTTPDVAYFYKDMKNKARFDLQRTFYFTKDLGDGVKEAVVQFSVPTEEPLSGIVICLGVRSSPTAKTDDAGVLFQNAELHRILLPWENNK